MGQIPACFLPQEHAEFLADAISKGVLVIAYL